MTQPEFNTIVQSGEGYKIEFKRNVNTDLSKELVALPMLLAEEYSLVLMMMVVCGVY